MKNKKQLEMERLKSFGETILSYAYESGEMSSDIYEYNMLLLDYEERAARRLRKKQSWNYGWDLR